MAISVQTRCSDCGTVVDQVIRADDPEVHCPECARNMPNLNRDEFKAIERTQSSQNLMSALAILLVLITMVLLALWVGFTPRTWISTDDKSIVREDTTLFLAGAGVCLLIAMVLGALGSRKRYVVDF